jgi:hypothetical protein
MFPRGSGMGSDICDTVPDYIVTLDKHRWQYCAQIVLLTQLHPRMLAATIDKYIDGSTSMPASKLGSVAIFSEFEDFEGVASRK